MRQCPQTVYTKYTYIPFSQKEKLAIGCTWLQYYYFRKKNRPLYARPNDDPRELLELVCPLVRPPAESPLPLPLAKAQVGYQMESVKRIEYIPAFLRGGCDDLVLEWDDVFERVSEMWSVSIWTPAEDCDWELGEADVGRS